MLELEHQYRIVDVHATLTPPSAAANGPAVTPERLEREMHQAGIVRAVVVPPTSPGSAYVPANNAVARHSVERPFVAFARINGPIPAGDAIRDRVRTVVSSRQEWHTSSQDVERYAYDDRFHGFVVDPAVDGFPDDDVVATLEDVGLPVIVRGGVEAPPRTIADRLVGRGFPIILAHFGGHPLDRSCMDAAIDLCGEYGSWYLETSAVRYRDILERALLEHPDRVLFGSGAPNWHPDVAVMEVLTLDLSADMLRRAFAKNATRVIDPLRPGVES